MAHDHRMNPVGEPYLNRKIMNTPQGYIDNYTRLLHALNNLESLPDDRAINLLRRHQTGISTSNEKSLLSKAVSQDNRFYARSRKPSQSYYTSPNRSFDGMGVATEDY